MVSMTIEDFMCTWDIYPIFDYEEGKWNLQKLVYLMDDYCPCNKIGFNTKDITRIFWKHEEYFQHKPDNISDWIEWLNDKMTNFYLEKCTYKTNNPYIDNIIGK